MVFTTTKAERNNALFADYLGGMSRKQVATKYGLGTGGVDTLLRRYGVTLPHSERSRRFRALPRPRSTGRPPVWPDCPDHLRAEYHRLQHQYRYSAVEARAMLEADVARSA